MGPWGAALFDDNYLETANDEIMVIVQIETEKAIDNLDEILSVEGIDCIFIGPSDLSGSLGLIGEDDSIFQSTGWALEILFLFGILILGILLLAMCVHSLRRISTEEDEDVQPFIPEPQTRFGEDRTEYYAPYHRRPPRP